MTLPSVDSGTAQKQRRTLKPDPHSHPGVNQSLAEPVVRDPVLAPEGYVRRRVDVKMPYAYALILHEKLRRLQDVGARLADGTEVSDHTKAVLWILENEVE